MGVIDSLEQTSGEAISSGEEWLKASKRYYELRVFKQLALGATSLFKLFTIGSVILLGFLFLTISVALWLGDYFGSLVHGFLITGGGIMFTALILFLSRKGFEKRIIKQLSKTYFD